MKYDHRKARLERFAQACVELIPKEWLPVGEMLFKHNGKVYDLSAADLKQLERIEREGHFLV